MKVVLSLIKINNLSKSFGEQKAVNQLSFSISEGEIFGFLGPNGAGKTTTIRMMIGLLKPNEGEVWINNLSVLTHAKEIHKKIGVVFDLPNLYVRSTIKENLMFFADLHDVSTERVHEVMESLHLMEMENKKVEKLSKGWKQRVLIARALLNNPSVLFLDEPTSGLDPNTAKLIRSYIKQLREQGTTIVLTTHDMHEADELSDRVGIMHQGNLVALDTPNNLKTKYGKSEIYMEYLVDNNIEFKKSALNDREAAELIYTKLLAGEIKSIHTKEALLSDVFAELTGSELS